MTVCLFFPQFTLIQTLRQSWINVVSGLFSCYKCFCVSALKVQEVWIIQLFIWGWSADKHFLFYIVFQSDAESHLEWANNKSVPVFTVTITKTIGREPDTTPICTNDPVNFITMIICKIKTETGESCRLLYGPKLGFNEDCDSRFRLLNENQLFFLHLTSLTPGDSGHYTCECSRTDGVYTVHLQVTVEGKCQCLS